jgi:hypothetical protein
LRTQIRPLVREAQPTVTQIAAGIPRLAKSMPNLFDSFQSLRYAMNVAAYNPPGNDEGNLFWLSWFLHNMDDTFSGGEAHGGTARASVVLNCQQATGALGYATLLKILTGTANLCPG